MSSNSNLNIWESLLKESSKRVQLPDGAALFLGNASCGKTALVSCVCADSDGPAVEEVPKIPDITAYDSFIASDIDESFSDNFSASRVGIWSISEKSFKGATSLVLHPSRIEKLVVMIGVDLSKPDECRTSLLAWLQFLRHQLDYSYFKVLSDAEVSAKKAQNEAYISSVRDRANMMNLKDLLCNFGVPLIVVGCKSDSLTVNDLTQLKKHEDAQREIRNICMKVGACLIYTCAKTGQNCALLKKYILHRLYHELMPMQLSIEHSSSALFVPAGLDTTELIAGVASSSDAMPVAALTANDFCGIEDPFIHTMNKASNEDSTVDSQQAILEDEQAWLANLSAEIEQAAAAQSVPSLGGVGSMSFDPSSSASGFSADKTMSIADKILAAGAETSGAQTKPAKISRRHSTVAATAEKKAAAPEDVKGFFESLMK